MGCVAAMYTTGGLKPGSGEFLVTSRIINADYLSSGSFRCAVRYTCGVSSLYTLQRLLKHYNIGLRAVSIICLELHSCAG